MLIPTNNCAERSRFEAKTGSYNDFPPGWREITERELSEKWFRWAVDGIEHRQMLGKGLAVSATLFHIGFNGDGYAMQAIDGRMKYYAFGCEHVWHETPNKYGWRCYHTYVCEKCKAEKAEDSSD